MLGTPGVRSVLSVGRVAGLVSPALFDLLVVSINSGTNRLRGLGACVDGGCRGMEVGVMSVSGVLLSRLLLKLVSTGVGNACFFPVASFFVESNLLLRVDVSMGSGANRRTFLVVSSTGMAWKRLGAGGGDVSDMIEGGIVCVSRDAELSSSTGLFVV